MITLYALDGGAEIKVRNYNWDDTLRIYTDVADVPAEVHPRLAKVKDMPVARLQQPFAVAQWSGTRTRRTAPVPHHRAFAMLLRCRGAKSMAKV